MYDWGMPDVIRRRPRLPAVRGGLAVVVAASACLVSCTGDEPVAERDAPRSTGSTTPPVASGAPASPSVAVTPDAEPTLELKAPAVRRPVVLADQLVLATRTVRRGPPTDDAVRRAAEFQQVALRALAIRPAELRRRVLAALPAGTASIARAGVAAARELNALSDPQPQLPSWRIVAPPAPDVLRAHYRAAQRRTGVPWTYLAAIHLVETRMGRIRGTSTAGAKGPMQFLPSTWDVYGAGGDINDPGDAIMAAARLLKANGAPQDMAEALWHYNPSDRYVRAVTEYARTIQRFDFAYHGYWHWRVLYRHERGTYLLPVGYPRTRAVLLADRQ